MLKNIYYNLIYSHILYAIQVWCKAGKIEIDKILVLQKRALRLISNKTKIPVNPCPLATTIMFFKLQITEVNDTSTFHITKSIHKCLNRETLENFHDWFKLNNDSHPYNTRSNIN